MKRVLAVCIGALLVSSCLRPAPEAGGEEIYLELCSNCHGVQLQGGLGPALGPGSNSVDQPDEFLRVSITDGRGRMPSFSSTLSESQVDRLISYLRQEQSG